MMKVFTSIAFLFRRGEGDGMKPVPEEFQFIAPSKDRASAPRRSGGYPIRPLCKASRKTSGWIRKKVPERYRALVGKAEVWRPLADTLFGASERRR